MWTNVEGECDTCGFMPVSVARENSDMHVPHLLQPDNLVPTCTPLWPQMKTKLLENRLEKAYVKYNQSMTHNKQLRDQIDNLRREKIMFLSIDANLERDLAKLKKSMAETIQLANVAFEAKEKVRTAHPCSSAHVRQLRVSRTHVVHMDCTHMFAFRALKAHIYMKRCRAV